MQFLTYAESQWDCPGTGAAGAKDDLEEGIPSEVID